MKNISRDYHDYVIKDGVLAREFELMYKNSNEIPWHQDKQSDWLDYRLTTEILISEGNFQQVVDYGCGLGYYLDLVKNKLYTNSICYGFDVSKTAIEKAKMLFSEIFLRRGT